MGFGGSGDERTKADERMKGQGASCAPAGDGKKGNNATGAHGDGDTGAGGADDVDPEVVFQLKDEDVLLGRGTRVHVHEGNIRFRVIVEKYARRYALADKNRSLRRDIAYKVIATIHQNGGRFLRGDVGSATKFWYVASEQAVFTKAKQALRDAGASRAAHWRESEKRSKALAAAATKTSLSRTMVRNATAKATSVRQRALGMELDQALELLLQQRTSASVTQDLLSRRRQLERQHRSLTAAAAGIINPPVMVGSSSALPLQRGMLPNTDHLLLPDRTAQVVLEAQLRSQLDKQQLDKQQLLALLGSSRAPQDLCRDQQIPLIALSSHGLDRSIGDLTHRTRP